MTVFSWWQTLTQETRFLWPKNKGQETGFLYDNLCHPTETYIETRFLIASGF